LINESNEYKTNLLRCGNLRQNQAGSIFIIFIYMTAARHNLMDFNRVQITQFGIENRALRK